MIGTFGDLDQPAAVQLSLGLLGVPARELRSRARPRPARKCSLTEDCALIHGFQHLLAATGKSKKTQQAYIYQLDQLLTAARRLGLPEDVGLIDLFRDQALLGRAIIDDRSASRGRLSRWTLAQRRAAVRAFARLMAPELRPLLGTEPEAVVIQALRLVAERIGNGYRLSGGEPRHRGGRVPTPSEIEAIIVEAARPPGFKGERNRALLTVLRDTGSRVNALREIEGHDIFSLPNGRMRLMLHAKGRSERREVELSGEASRLLFDYIETFNRAAGLAGSLERITLGDAGPVWRGSWRKQWAYQGVAKIFDEACVAAGVHAYRLHSLRRAFATDVESALPRRAVASAGGWHGLDRLDNHYIRPRWEHISKKLGGEMFPGPALEPDHAAAPV